MYYPQNIAALTSAPQAQVSSATAAANVTGASNISYVPIQMATPLSTSVCTQEDSQNQNALMMALLQLQQQQQKELSKSIGLMHPQFFLTPDSPLSVPTCFSLQGTTLSPYAKGVAGLTYDLNDLQKNLRGKRKLGDLLQPSLKRPRDFRDVNSIRDEDSDKIRAIIAFLERVERPRTWSPEETYCLAQVIIENAALIKQVRYKELHQYFLEKLRLHFGLETKKTRQAFWARHCRIREKLGVEKYNSIFWGDNTFEELKKELKVES